MSITYKIILIYMQNGRATMVALPHFKQCHIESNNTYATREVAASIGGEAPPVVLKSFIVAYPNFTSTFK